MSTPRNGYIWLENASFGNGRFARVARSRTPDTMTVLDVRYDRGNALSRVVGHVQGSSPLVGSIKFAGPDQDEWLIYHPGASTLQHAKEAYAYLHFILVMGLVVKAGAQSRSAANAAGIAWKVPDELWEQAGRAGQADMRNLVAGAFDVKDLSRYPHEGYYFLHEPPDLLVAGKIRGDDIHSN